MTIELTIPETIEKHPTWYRLQNQRHYYSQESNKNKKKYHTIKVHQIVLAGSIPILSLIDFPSSNYIVAIIGAIVAVLEGVQQLFQFHTLWFNYRSTSEKLKHEAYLFLALSGPYRGLPEEKGLLLLAERIEEHISTEHVKWVETLKTDENKTSREDQPPQEK